MLGEFKHRPEANAGEEGPRSGLNDAHRLQLRVSFEYMDKVLAKIEEVVRSEECPSPFIRYQMDISPAQGRVIEDYIRRFRLQLTHTLAWQDIELLPPNISATSSIATQLRFIETAIFELRPSQMQGAGPLTEASALELTGVLRELSSVTENMMFYVKRELGVSLRQRVERLTSSEDSARLLERIEHVMTERGLVEFRPRMDMLLTRLENPTFDIAVFGRVSAGKSSFLNALLGAEVLPVGANPVTAFPTRLQYGTRTEAIVRFAGEREQEVPIEKFRELVSEMSNPGNREGVLHASIKIPSNRLTEGIVLVDTPGLGSLALRGAKETLAYLPSCDLAILLVDAGSTLTLEDIGTLRLLLEADIPILILLSKADLIAEDQRANSTSYIEQQILHQLRSSIPVRPVSSLAAYRGMVDQFYQMELKPRFARNTELRKASVNSKLALLKQDLKAVLQSQLDRNEFARTVNPILTEGMEKTLTGVAGRLGDVKRILEEKILALELGTETLIQERVNQLAAMGPDQRPVPIAWREITQQMEEAVRSQVAELAGILRDAAQSSAADVAGVGRDLGSRGTPDESETVALIRDVPRFEMAEMCGTVDVGLWDRFGQRIFAHGLKRVMMQHLRLPLGQALAAYGGALKAWAASTFGSILTLVDSFADVYRASILAQSHAAYDAADIDRIREDIALLE